jgi:hypothetical protein
MRFSANKKRLTFLQRLKLLAKEWMHGELPHRVLEPLIYHNSPIARLYRPWIVCTSFSAASLSPCLRRTAIALPFENQLAYSPTVCDAVMRSSQTIRSEVSEILSHRALQNAIIDELRHTG